MARSISTFIALFRGTLRLLMDEVPMGQRDVIGEITGTIKLDLGVLEKVLDLKEVKVEIKGDPLRVLFGDYLQVLEEVAGRVDTLLEEHGQ
jgi:hypothetical protein